jgi:hypothetical protein
MVEDLEKKKWWGYIHDDIKEFLVQSLLLVETAEKWETHFTETFGRGTLKKEGFHDYSFIVFPAAKAYEGFLKKLFLDLGFISEDDYYGKHFRVGKALNPSLEKEIREREGVYDKIVNYCGGETLAERMWICWKECRNLLFHFFPNEKNAISLVEAKERVILIIETMDGAFEECRVDRSR